MSLETKLIGLALDLKKSAVLITAEFEHLYRINYKYNGQYFVGRESHLKVLSYRNLLEIYGVQK